LDDLLLTVKTLLDIQWPADKIHIYILDDGFNYQHQNKKMLQMSKVSKIIPGANELPEDSLSVIEEHVGNLPRVDCATKTFSWEIRSLDLPNTRCRITLIAREKPSDSHYKAGNINNFLYNYCPDLAEKRGLVHQYMLILDHDMLAAPNILQEAIPQFSGRETLAFVQFPQRFYDITTNDRFYAGNEIFYDGVQMNRSNVGLAAFAGTNAVWQMSALYHIGGIQYGSLTEDAHTGLKAHNVGYTSKYVPYELCVGQSPQTTAAAMRQRMRWSQGAVEMIFCTKSEAAACPLVLKPEYKLPDLPEQSLWNRFVLKVIYTDSMIYPFYSFGYLFHVVVCLIYLLNIQSPMSPSHASTVLVVWLPLYIIKTFTQILAFPHVTLGAQFNAQKAWAGYAFSTLISIMHSFSCGRGEWFNTGSMGGNSWFWIQYGNTSILIIVMGVMVYRVIAFTVFDETCFAWMTAGSLCYGGMMIFLVKDWALEPFRHALYSRQENKYHKNPGDNRTDIFSFAMRNAVRSRDIDTGASHHTMGRRRASYIPSNLTRSEVDVFTYIQKHVDAREAYERHSINLSVIINLFLILLVSCTLSIWATGNCDRSNTIIKDVGGFTNSKEDWPKLENPLPPFPAELSGISTDFQAVSGGLTLNGNPFSLKGANWFGFETTRNMAFGLNTVSQDAVFKMLVQNGINAIRLPLAVENILNPSTHHPLPWAIHFGLNPHFNEGMDYLEAVEVFIERAAQWGVFTLLDMHLLRTDKHPDPLPYDDKTPFESVIQAWDVLSERMCNMWGIMGADLKNEPYNATWGDGTSTDWRLMAEILAETVTSKCPQWLIFVAGIFTYESASNPLSKDASGSWGSMLLPAKDFPIRVSNKNKLVYSPHVYGPGTIGGLKFMWNQADNDKLRRFCRKQLGNSKNQFSLNTTEFPNDPKQGLTAECVASVPFEGNRFPNNLPATYDLWFGFLSKKLNMTVIIGEWGGTYVNQGAPHVVQRNEDKEYLRTIEVKWNEALVDYLLKSGMGSFYWSINPESIDTGGMLLEDWISPDTAKMSLLKRLPSTPTLPLLLPSTRTITPLRSCLDKNNLEILFAQDSGPRYDYELYVYNKDYDDTKHPVVIVIARDENDVSAAVKCSHKHGIQICIRSGGHSYVGDSICDGTLIDIRGMKSIVRGSGSSTFWVESGNTIGDLAVTLHDHGHIAPTVNHNGVGSGWILGCGYGWLSRSFGLGCDRILSARLVTYNGTIVEATDSNEHANLLWALRGAGSGQFGVVTSYLIEAFPLQGSESFTYFKLQWPRARAKDIYVVWQDWAVGHSNNNFTCNFILWNPKQVSVQLEGALFGTFQELNNILSYVLMKVGNPSADERVPFGYLEYMAHVTGSNDVLQFRNPQSGYSGERRSFRNKSHILFNRLDSDGIDALISHANEEIPGSNANSNYIQISPLGGIIEFPAHPTAFSHRSAIAVAHYGGYWTTDESKAPMLNHQRRFRQSMEYFWGNYAFYNYKDNELNKWEEAYWGKASIERLIQAKCYYDHLNLFSTMRQSLKCQEN